LFRNKSALSEVAHNVASETCCLGTTSRYRLQELIKTDDEMIMMPNAILKNCLFIMFGLPVKK
jgi:hypothetical protein